MKVALVNPNTRNIGRIATTNPPLGLLYMASYLKREGHEVCFVDADIDDLSISDVLVKIKDCQIVGITMTTMQASSAYKLADHIRLYFAGSKIVVAGGAHASGRKEQLFFDCPSFDFCVVGEGEKAFVDLVNGYADGYLPKQRVIQYNRMNIDDLVFPDFEVAEPLDRYKPYYPANRGKKPLPVMASRGCVFGCHFCGTNVVWGRQMSYRKPENVVEEIQFLHKRYGADEIYFLDDALNYNRGWVDALLDRIISLGLHRKMVFKGSIRANKNLVDYSLVEKFKKAGFWALAMGVESGNQKVRDSIGKNLLTEDVERAFKLLRKAKIDVIASFMIGHILDDEQTVEDTIRFALKLNPDQYDFPLTTPLPNTVLEAEADRLGLIHSKNWGDYAMGKSVMNTKFLCSNRLVELRDSAFARMKRKKLVDRMKRDPVFACQVLSRKLIKTFKGVKT